jgi:hypothetical protein
MRYQLVRATLASMFIGLCAWSQCPVITRGSFCAEPNDSPPYYAFCRNGMIGDYFDDMALTFTVESASATHNGGNCGYDCVSRQNCVKSTISLSGPDCNGVIQSVNHSDCCEITVD